MKGLNLIRLVNQLLDFQRLEGSHKKHASIPLNLIGLIHACGQYLSLGQPAAGYKIVLTMNGRKLEQLTDSERVIIRGNIDSLEKIIFNYLSNAMKYSPAGGTIELGVITSNDKVRLFVKDEGIGISMALQDRLFKVFSQIDDSTTRQYEGSGLGLALVKELVMTMGGEVGVESEEGRGATFWADFPLLKEIRPILDLLIVDDEVDLLNLLELSLSRENFVFRFAQNCKEARLLIANYQIRVIVTDFHMEGEDGISLLSAIAAEQPDCRRVLLTGYADRDVLQRSINMGQVQAVYTKPIDMKQMIADLGALIAQSPVQMISEIEADFAIKDWLLASFEQQNEAISDDETCLNGDRELILVIDDLKDMRDLIAKMLGEKGFRVLLARDGFEGLAKVQKYHPDLVVVDWMMPKMSGPDFINELRGDEKINAIPVVLLTAKADAGSRIEGTQIGADAFIGKPFDELELLSTLTNMLRLKSSERKIVQPNRNLTENVIKRFLPPALVEDIVNGRKEITDAPQLQSVTVLFADICGFSRISEKLGALKMAAMINGYFNAMSETIFEHGGTIDKFIGDGIMVLFGTPVSLKANEQVRKAIACAISMQRTMARLNAMWEAESLPRLQMRIGMNYGPAFVGSFGGKYRMEYTAIGNTVNMAARIQAVAMPESVYFSSMVRDYIAGEVWERAGEYHLKGIKEKCLLYRLKQERMEQAA